MKNSKISTIIKKKDKKCFQRKNIFSKKEEIKRKVNKKPTKLNIRSPKKKEKIQK